ncbi:MAG: endolytic transglycosylase MltG [Acidimicrobiales bacterium]
MGGDDRDIARILETNEVIPNSTFFRYYTDYKNEGDFQAGEYTFQVNSSADEAIAVLNGGPKPQAYKRFTVREGLWIPEILDSLTSQFPAIARSDFEAVLNEGVLKPRYRPDGQTSWEGLLFPDTYEVNAEATAYDILLKMSDQFSQVTGSWPTVRPTPNLGIRPTRCSSWPRSSKPRSRSTRSGSRGQRHLQPAAGRYSAGN